MRAVLSGSESIANRVADVESAIATRCAEPVKKAVAVLDDATRRLAAFLIERAVRASSLTFCQQASRP